jgi:hypothetical protein
MTHWARGEQIVQYLVGQNRLESFEAKRSRCAGGGPSPDHSRAWWLPQGGWPERDFDLDFIGRA